MFWGASDFGSRCFSLPKSRLPSQVSWVPVVDQQAT
jgi:hypothetical protein